MKEYIVSVSDKWSGTKQMFVGAIRHNNELIRCKDCKYWSWEAAGCKKYNGLTLACTNDFCSRAERKEE